MRRGLPGGCTSATAAWITGRGNTVAEAIRDRSAAGLTVTQTGTLELARDAYGTGLYFGSSGAARLAFAAQDLSGGYSIRGRCKTTEPGNLRPLVVCRATGVSEDDGFAVYGAADTLAFAVYDASGTLFQCNAITYKTPSGLQGGGVTDGIGFLDWCVSVTPGGYIELWANGVLIGRKVAPATLPTAATLPPIWIGQEASLTATDAFTGVIADVQLRLDGGVVDRASLAPNIATDQISRKQIAAVDWELPVNTQEAGWVLDAGTGCYFLSIDDTALGACVLTRLDIASVRVTVDPSTDSWTEVGNLTDLSSGASTSWFFDSETRLLWATGEVTAAFYVAVRVPLANHAGVIRGTTYYIPALRALELGERKFPYFGQAYPTMGGAPLTIAAHHPDIAALEGIQSEEASSVSWPGATARVYSLTDGLPWGEATALACGFIEKAPADNGDAWTVQHIHEPGRIHRSPLAPQVCDRDTFPNRRNDDDGKPFLVHLGGEHKRQKLLCIDATPGATQWQASGLAISKIVGLGTGNIRLGQPNMYDVDLNLGGRFRAPGLGPEMDLWADLVGLGEPSDPTTAGPVAEWGDEDDAYRTPGAIFKALLNLGGRARDAFDPSFDDFDNRSRVRRRVAAPMGDGNALNRQLQAHAAETLGHIGHEPATRKWWCRDVIRADEPDWYLTEPDLVNKDRGWITDKSMLAKKLNARACVYLSTMSGVIAGDATTLDLDTEERADVRDAWSPPWGMTGFSTKAGLDLWLEAVRGFFEHTSYFLKVVVTPRFLDVRQMDKVRVLASILPAGAETDFRVQAVKPRADGTIELLLFSEQLYPPDASAGAGDVDETRHPAPFNVQMSYSASSPTGYPQVVTPTQIPGTTPGWQRVGNSLHLLQRVRYPQGGGPSAPGVTHRFQARALRHGGGSDGDVALALCIIDPDGTPTWRLFSTSGVPATTLSPNPHGHPTQEEPDRFPTAATSFEMPDDYEDCLAELQAVCTGGASAELWCASIVSKETVNVTRLDPMCPHLIAGDGYAGGRELERTGPPGDMPGNENWRPVPLAAFTTAPSYAVGTTFRLVCYVDPGESTTLRLSVFHQSFAQGIQAFVAREGGLPLTAGGTPPRPENWGDFSRGAVATEAVAIPAAGFYELPFFFSGANPVHQIRYTYYDAPAVAPRFFAYSLVQVDPAP